MLTIHINFGVKCALNELNHLTVMNLWLKSRSVVILYTLLLPTEVFSSVVSAILSFPTPA